MPAKERKALFNTFCANAVEERRKVEAEQAERSSAQLRELFVELLGVTPLQFRLFREGKGLEEVEKEVEAEEALRSAMLEGGSVGGSKEEEKGGWLGGEEGVEEGEMPACSR